MQTCNNQSYRPTLALSFYGPPYHFMGRLLLWGTRNTLLKQPTLLWALPDDGEETDIKSEGVEFNAEFGL